jgi:hypothetical protein
MEYRPSHIPPTPLTSRTCCVLVLFMVASFGWFMLAHGEGQRWQDALVARYPRLFLSEPNRVRRTGGLRSGRRDSQLPAARDYLNAPRSQADLLVKHGFIKPHMSRTSLFGARDQYAIADLDNFLGRLTHAAQRIARPSYRQVTIQRAAKQACCSAADIVRLILEERLGWVGRLPAVRGYRSVLVNIDHVKDAVRGPGHGGVPLRTVAQELSTTDRVVTALIEGKHLATITGINPINRCP